MEKQNVVRRLRRAARLAQHEFADLLGTSQSAVSRIEAGGDPPEGDCMATLTILFGKSLAELFPARCERAAEGLVARAAALDRRLAQRAGKTAQRKRLWLRGIIERVNVTPA